MIARVRGPMAASPRRPTATAGRSPRTSANTGVAPAWTTAAAVAAKVSDGSTTSSPGASRSPRRSAERGRAARDRDRVTDAEDSRELHLERRHLRPLGQPPRAVGSGDRLDLLVAESDVAQRDDPDRASRTRHPSTSISSARGLLGRAPDARDRRRWLHRRPSRGGAEPAGARCPRAVSLQLARRARHARLVRRPRTPKGSRSCSATCATPSRSAGDGGIEVAFHLGAQIAIPYSYLNPRDFFETNVGGTLNVAQAALAADVQRVVHVSTSEVYGEPQSWPITERAPARPRSPYAASKVGADMLMRLCRRRSSCPW